MSTRCEVLGDVAENEAKATGNENAFVFHTLE